MKSLLLWISFGLLLIGAAMYRQRGLDRGSDSVGRIG